ncbi:uncharacterized protein LOC129327711 [Eublepharis macularius]|uniref:Uncharacterized protein LOC129327711 n=1 Tax=Eublepharis macularius TaxID=481883 RepID=A0AA97KVT5_EUBMA|nr:uncharacterized protein LOC129327711 [Eublepharis macularius]
MEKKRMVCEEGPLRIFFVIFILFLCMAGDLKRLPGQLLLPILSFHPLANHGSIKDITCIYFKDCAPVFYCVLSGESPISWWRRPFCQSNWVDIRKRYCLSVYPHCKRVAIRNWYCLIIYSHCKRVAIRNWYCLIIYSHCKRIAIRNCCSTACQHCNGRGSGARQHCHNTSSHNSSPCHNHNSSPHHNHHSSNHSIHHNCTSNYYNCSKHHNLFRLRAYINGSLGPRPDHFGLLVCRNVDLWITFPSLLLYEENRPAAC